MGQFPVKLIHFGIVLLSWVFGSDADPVTAAAGAIAGSQRLETVSPKRIVP